MSADTKESKAKDARAMRVKETLVVSCPYCQGKHYHPPIDFFKGALPAPCGKGQYVIREIVKMW